MKTHKNETEILIENLYTRYKKVILYTIKKYVGPSPISEDLFHDVFIKIIHHAEKLSNMTEQQMLTYILMIARGVSIDYLRKSCRYKTINVEDEFFQNDACNISTETFDKYSRVDLSLMLSCLTADEHDFLLGKYYLGLSSKELADIYTECESTVRSKIHRAKKKLLNHWMQAGLNMEDFFND